MSNGVFQYLQSWAQYVIPGAVWIITLSVALSTFGGLNGSMFYVGRYVHDH